MTNALTAEIEALQNHFAQGLQKRMDDFNAAYEALQQTLGKPESLKHIQTMEACAHSLSGASGTFMFQETHNVARVLEAECTALREQGQPVHKGEAIELLSLIRSLSGAIQKDRTFANNEPADKNKLQEISEETINILLVEDDDIQASVLKLQMANFGLHTDLVKSPDKIKEIDFTAENAPDIVLMDIMFDGDHNAGLRIVQELRDQGKLNIPVIFISARDDFNARLHAVRCSSDGYIAKPVDVLELSETIKRLLLSANEDPYDVLMIGADKEVQQAFADMLEDTNMSCRAVENPADVMEALAERSPHAILMNNILPDCSGVELSSMIRQVNNKYARIPIVFFSEEAPDKQRLVDLRACGDDMLVLPVDPDIFTLSLTARCKRTRDVREIIKQRRQVDQRFYALSETVNDAVITTNADHRIIFWNNTAEKLFGYPASDTIGMHISMIFAKEYHDIITKTGATGVIHTSATEQNKPVEMYGIDHLGDDFPVEVSATKWSSEDHGYVGYIIRDITERKRTEETLENHRIALAQKTKILQTTMDSIDQGLVVWDENYNMLVHSRKCLDFWYHPDPNIVAPGTSMLELMRHLAQKGAFGDCDIEETARTQVERVMNEGDHSSEEITLLDKSILDIHRFPMPGGGYVAKYTDITQEKQSKQALEEAALTEKAANQAKSEFLSSMSHELRTPMNAILGFAQMMTISKKDSLSERQQAQVDHILKAGNHLLRLIDEILDLSKIEAGKIDYSITSVDFKSVVDECLIYVGNSAIENKVSVEIIESGALQRHVKADEKCLRQIMINFLSNAIKYNKPDGCVSVRLEEKENNTARISVTDTGIGIPEHHMADLFQTFNRLHATDSDIQGNGIGLAICKKLVELMKGSIGVDSVDGQGSTFWIELPFAEK